MFFLFHKIHYWRKIAQHYNRWNELNKDGKLKIGFNLKYNVSDGREFSHTIRNVKDNYAYEGYILIFHFFLVLKLELNHLSIQLYNKFFL